MKPGDPAKRHSHPWLFRAGALLLSLLLSVLIIELGMALIGRLIYSPPRFGELRGSADGSVNFNVVCLGDSHTYGVGAPAGRDYPATLESILNQRAGRREFGVMNFGLPGRNTSDALLQLERMFQEGARPNVIVVCVGKNNMNSLRNATILPERVRELSLPERLDYMLAHSATYRLSKMTVQRFRELRVDRDARVDDENARYGEFVPTRREPFLYEWALQDYASMAERCAANGVPLVLMSYWEPIGFVDRAMRRTAETQPRVYWLDQRFPLIALPAYAQTLISLPDLHPNERGYYRIAARLADFLVDQGLVQLEQPQ